MPAHGVLPFEAFEHGKMRERQQYIVSPGFELEAHIRLRVGRLLLARGEHVPGVSEPPRRRRETGDRSWRRTMVPDYYVMLGRVAESEGHAAEARTRYAHALELQPDYEDAARRLRALGGVRP